MANSSEILTSLLRDPPPSDGPVTYQWLVPNEKGLENFRGVFDAFNASSSTVSKSGSAIEGDTGPAQNTSTYDANAMPDSTSGVSSTSSPSSSSSPGKDVEGDTGPALNTSSYDANAMPDRLTPLSSTTSGSTSTHHTTTHEISLFTAATEAFSQKNLNKSISSTLQLFRHLIHTTSSRSPSTRFRAYISVSLGCPFAGLPSPHDIASLTSSLLELGAYEVCLADTTGHGTALTTRHLLKTLKAAGIKMEDLALHFHDTYGMALVNALVGVEEGVRVFDGSVAGLGGCPFCPGGTGNVGSEDLLNFFGGLGMEVEGGARVREVAETGRWISKELGRANESRAGRAMLSQGDRDVERAKL